MYLYVLLPETVLTDKGRTVGWDGRMNKCGLSLCCSPPQLTVSSFAADPAHSTPIGPMTVDQRV